MLYSSPNHRVFSFDVILFTKSLCFFPWCYTLHQIIAFFPLVLYSSPNHCVFSLDITLFTKSSCFFPWCYTLHQIIVFFPLMLHFTKSLFFFPWCYTLRYIFACPMLCISQIWLSSGPLLQFYSSYLFLILFITHNAVDTHHLFFWTIYTFPSLALLHAPYSMSQPHWQQQNHSSKSIPEMS